MTISDDDLSKLYDGYLEYTGNQAEMYPAAAVASVMLTQALGIYRAIMSEDDFSILLDKIGDDKIPTPSLISKKHTLQ
jgi:hypothetical protein